MAKLSSGALQHSENHLRTRPISAGHLRAFEAVARHLNFRAASEELSLTQSAVSRQIQAMEEEIRAHEDNDHWEIVSREDIPINTPVLPAIWSMRRKQRIDTREVYKWKARLTIHGGKQIRGVNYWETFSPVVRWSTI